MFNIHKIINEAIATQVMKWEVVETPSIFMVDDETVWKREDGCEIGASKFQPSINIKDAQKVAEKLGMALIPQTSEEGFHWYACCVEEVSNTGDEIKVIPLNDSGVSAETAPMAICLAALYSFGIEVETYDTENN